MNKIFLMSLIGTIVTTGANAATAWWKQPSICRLSTTTCYPSMGAGYDREFWDTSSNCRGMKLICPNALRSTTEVDPVPMGKKDLARGTNINTDFDINVLAGNCFGARKTSANGTQVTVGGKPVFVWCRGVLDANGFNVDEIVSGGEISTSRQPTSCRQLEQNGYAAVLDGKCYGKYYNPSEYHIDCGNNASLRPERLIILNGADPDSGTSGGPETQSDAAAQFKAMRSAAEVQRKKYFNQD